jgi:hypothetical protein
MFRLAAWARAGEHTATDQQEPHDPRYEYEGQPHVMEIAVGAPAPARLE